MGREWEVNPLGKLARLPCLDSEKMAHMESITFHLEQPKISVFSQTSLFRIIQAKPQTSSYIFETYRENSFHFHCSASSEGLRMRRKQDGPGVQP